MSFHSAPVQAGGAAVLGASALKAGSAAAARGSFTMALTGVQALQFLTALGLMLITLGAVLVRRGKGSSMGGPSFD
jgi:LPXTG-motif cell wall-anchored protein